MRKRILILDDDDALLDVLEILLNNNGYDTLLLKDTDNLFSSVRAYQPSMILLDLRLNGQDGGEWCAKLKSHHEFKSIPVMIFTASSLSIEKGNFGCDDFIAKPFDIDEIMAHINQLSINRIIN